MLGWLRAEQGDRLLTRFRTRKTALLLARLALFPQRAHAREELADLLWPEADLEAGRNRLKQSLAILRRLLEPPGAPPGSILIADRTTIRLNPAAVSTDVADLEAALKAKRLREAAALYRGELLPSFYDDWVIEERERLAAVMDGVHFAPEETAPPAEAPPAPALPLPTLNLPPQWTRFFGRDREKAEIAEWLRDPETRLLTVTGPGGMGKTRLALEAARQTAPLWENQVHFAALAEMNDARRIAEAIADALRLTRVSTSEPMAQVVAALAAQPALLVLDNLEQLGEAAAPYLLSLLSRIPTLTILATSRQRLFVAGEREFPLASLPLPQGGFSPESLRLSPGVQLFADRAQAACPDFQITPRNAEAVGDICRHLEGIPLALELAAAWAQALTPSQMRERLTERFRLLVSRRKEVAERHRTLWATIAWSYDLLPPDLAGFWAKLAVFRGGWTAGAAAEVCGQPEASDFLTRLRARSLVIAEDRDGEMRYRLLETLREFGWMHLPEDDRRALAGRHAAYFLALAEQAEPLLTGPDQAHWLDRLAAEQDNLRAALGMHFEAAETPNLRLRLAGALWRFWAIRGPLGEGRRFLEQALNALLPAEAGKTPAEARARNGLAILARRQGDMDVAGEEQRRSLALWRTLGDTRGIASSLNNLGTLATLVGDFAGAEPVLRESLLLWRELEKPLAVAQTLNNLGFLAHERGDLPAAHRDCTESLSLFRTLADKHGITLSLTVLAMVSADTGEHDQARALCRDVFAIAQELNDPQTAVTCLELLADIACARGEMERAARLLGSARGLRDQFGAYQDGRAQARAEHLASESRRALPEAEFAAHWNAGQAMTLEQAIADALEENYSNAA